MGRAARVSTGRSTLEVFEAHLECRCAGASERDIEENYAREVILLTELGTFRGHDGVREGARNLHRYLPEARFEYRTKRVEGEYAFLEWRATSPAGVVRDGADAFVIRGGRIVAQMIHYHVE